MSNPFHICRIQLQKKKSGIKKCLEICAIKGAGGRRLMANTILNFHFNYLHTSLISKANLSRTEWLLLRESGLASALSRNSLNRFERIKNSYFMFLKIWKCVIVGQLRRQPLLEEDRSDVLHFQDKPHCTGLNLSLRLVYLPLRIL